MAGDPGPLLLFVERAGLEPARFFPAGDRNTHTSYGDFPALSSLSHRAGICAAARATGFRRRSGAGVCRGFYAAFEARERREGNGIDCSGDEM